MRCLSFLFSIAEANGFSAYSAFASDGNGLTHTKWCTRCATSLLCIAAMERDDQENEGILTEAPISYKKNNSYHQRLGLGKLKNGVDNRKKKCIHCNRRTTKYCKCDENKVFCSEHFDAHLTNPDKY